MRRALLPIFLLLLACDKDERAKQLAESVTGDASSPTFLPALEAGTVAVKTDAAARPMPERPIPKGQTTVGATMPQEVQMKAIGYMMAMRTPHPDDAPADPAYAKDLAEKLKPIILSMDKGADKARFNRVEVIANGRQIDLLMAGGCDEKAPMTAVVNRAGIQVPTLLQHGVLVVRCNDAKIQCLQSLRDVEDVLCTTAPRHK